MPTPQLTAKNSPEKEVQSICLFGQTTYRNQVRRFGIKTDDRRRHMYVIGKTGMGKTTLLENMVLSDIYNGHGIGLVDPHGDFAEKIINFIPSNRINDVVYINPADTEYPIGFNILEVKNDDQKHLISAGLMGTFKKIWPDVWSSRMEYILNNTLLALLDCPGTTLLGINRLLSDKAYRRRIVRQVKDPVVKAFWEVEFASYEERYAKEAVAPIQNKIGQFLSASVIRNMVAQVKSTIDIRELMDSQKIVIMNLSKGRIGEDNSRLLGGMLITKIQLSAMERVDTPEAERKDFFLYVDEFQNFATPSFANILSEARKYRLSLIMAHQYVLQLDEVVANAVFGNVGTIVTFRVGGADAELLVKEYTPTFIEDDIVNLPKFHILLKLMIDGVASQPFTAMTMGPIGSATGSSEKVVRVSRERYGRFRELIEEKILRWSGMGEMDEDDDGADEYVPKKPAKTAQQPQQPQQLPEAKKAAPLKVVASVVPPKPLAVSQNIQPAISAEVKTSTTKIVEEKMIITEESKSSSVMAVPRQIVAPPAVPAIPASFSSDTTSVQSNQNAGIASSSMSQDGVKKKRKRRRKKKNGEGGGGASPLGIGNSTPLRTPSPAPLVQKNELSQSVLEVKREQNSNPPVDIKPVTSEPSVSGPKKIDPNTPITFS